MARKAKEHVIFNNVGDKFTGTIVSLMDEVGPLTRTHLYRPTGARADDGTTWRIGAQPVIDMMIMHKSSQWMFNIYEQAQMDYAATGDTGLSVEIDEIDEIIESYRRNYFIKPCLLYTSPSPRD